MEELEKDKVEEVLNKATSIPTIGYVSLIVSIVGLGLLIYGIIDIHNNFTSIFYIVFGVIFSLFIFIYLFQRYKVKSNIKNVNLENVKIEMNEKTTKIGLYKTYFTKNYLISYFYSSFIVNFKDILWVYKKKSPNLSDSDNIDFYTIVIYDKYGKKYQVPDDEIILNTILDHNKNILFGYEKENRKKYKELLKENNK